MKFKNKLLVPLCLFGAGFGHLLAQSVVSTAGGESLSPAARLSWTMGEVITETPTQKDVILTQGYQQSKLEVISLNSDDPVSSLCNLFPNPTNGNLVIDFRGRLDKDSKYSIYDSNGNEVIQNNLVQQLNFLSLRNLSSGNYILKVTSPGLSGGIFKIIKTN